MAKSGSPSQQAFDKQLAGIQAGKVQRIVASYGDGSKVSKALFKATVTAFQPRKDYTPSISIFQKLKSGRIVTGASYEDYLPIKIWEINPSSATCKLLYKFGSYKKIIGSVLLEQGELAILDYNSGNTDIQFYSDEVLDEDKAQHTKLYDGHFPAHLLTRGANQIIILPSRGCRTQPTIWNWKTNETISATCDLTSDYSSWELLDDRSLLGGRDDGNIEVWSLERLLPERTIEAHKGGQVNALKVLPGGLLVSAGGGRAKALEY